MNIKNYYTFFSALTLFTLGGMLLPVMASSNSASPNAQETTSASFQTQGKVQLAQAGGNCRKISKVGGTILLSNSNGTGGGEVLAQGTSVGITKNVSGNFIQVDTVNGKPRVGFVSKLALTSCTPPTASCYKVRNLAEIANMGGLPIRQTPSLNSAAAFRRLAVGDIFRGANPPQKLDANGLKWVKIAPINGVDGYVSDGPTNSSVRNLELVPPPC